MRGQFFIHIGLPKTATTFLQLNVFPRIENIEFLGKAKRVDFYDVYNSPHNKFLISHEHLLACPSERYPDGWLDEFSTRLALLASRFPSVKIMLSFRAHEALLTSYYKEYISKPGRPYLTLDKFFDVGHNQGLIRHEDLEFSSLIDLVERHFDEKPFVFLFEDVVRRLPIFLEDLSAFLGERLPDASAIRQDKLNPGVGYHQAKILVKLNQLDGVLQKVPFLPGLYNPVFKRLSIQPDRLCRKKLAFLSKRPLLLSDEQREFVTARYHDDWIIVQDYVVRQRSELKASEQGRQVQELTTRETL
jgi:hypothetical protein